MTFEPGKLDVKYVIGMDAAGANSERTSIHCSDIGFWDVDAFKNVKFIPAEGSSIAYFSIPREAFTVEPTDPAWWDELLAAIEKRCDR